LLLLRGGISARPPLARAPPLPHQPATGPPIAEVL